VSALYQMPARAWRPVVSSASMCDCAKVYQRVRIAESTVEPKKGVLFSAGTLPVATAAASTRPASSASLPYEKTQLGVPRSVPRVHLYIEILFVKSSTVEWLIAPVLETLSTSHTRSRPSSLTRRVPSRPVIVPSM